MNLLNAINSFSSNMESMGALFGQGSAGLQDIGARAAINPKAFADFMRGAVENAEEGFGGLVRGAVENAEDGFGGLVRGAVENAKEAFGGLQLPQVDDEFSGYLEGFMLGAEQVEQAAAEMESQADKFLASLEQRGIDPKRFLADLESEGIDPKAFLADLNREGVTPNEFVRALNNNDKKSKSALSLNEVAEKAARLGGTDLKDFIAAGDSVVDHILSKNRLNLKNTDVKDSPFSFMKGGKNNDLAELAATLDTAKAALPNTFKKQLGQSLIALGRENHSASSMKMGAELMGAKNGVSVLKDMLETLDAELPVLRLDKEALPELGELMAESGMDNAEIQEMLGDLAKGDMDLDQVFFMLSKATNDLEQKGALVATKEGLAGLGQLFTSIGASPETVEAIVNGFEPGEKITSAALKDIIGASDEALLNAPISEASAENLSNALKAMGASPRQMNTLANLLQETQGKMSVNDFANFFDEMGPGKDVSVGSKELELIKNIMANITRDQEIAKTPVFNEILTKLQALGDQEIDEDFAKMSPGLQALRGGISAESAENNLGGQMGQNGQPNQEHNREAKEQYKQAMAAIHTGADTTGSGIQTTEAVQNYGYGGHDTLARQISQKILYSHNKNIHRLRMKLNPESMGGLDIELKVKDGELTAHIKAESRAAYEALAGEIDDLKNALAEGGVKLGNMTLAFDNQESGQREFADLGMRGTRAARSAENENAENMDPAIINHIAQMAAEGGHLSRMV